MIDDDAAFGLLMAVIALCGVSFFIGGNFGEDRGKIAGREATIILCVEKPQVCKVSYDYLKLKEKG